MLLQPRDAPDAAPCCGSAAATAQVVAALGAHGWDRVRLALVGPPGSGRSHVLRDLRTVAYDRGVTTVVASAADDGRSRVGVALHHLTGRAGARTPATGGTGDAPTDRRARSWDDDPPPSVTAVLDHLGSVGRGSGAVVLLDDAEPRGDADLRALLTGVLRDLPDGVSVVRVGDSGEAADAFGETVVALTPWCPRHAGDLLDTLPRPPAEPVRARLLAQAAGNPLALAELGHRAAEHPEWALPGLVVLPPPSGLVEVFAPGLPTLSLTAREGLAVAAAARGELCVVRSVVPQAVEDPDWTVAFNNGWLHRRGARVHFRHPMTRAAAHHAVTPSRMRLLHRRIAAEHDLDSAYRAWHLALGGGAPDERVALTLERAAVRLTATGAVHAAVEVLATAAAVTPQATARDRRVRTAARIARAVDEPARAEALDVLAPLGTTAASPADPVTALVDRLLAATVELAATGRPADPGALAAAAGSATVEPTLRWWASVLHGLADRAAGHGVAAIAEHADGLRRIATLTATPAVAVTRAVGITALLADETATAVDLLATVAGPGRDGRTDREAAVTLAWAYADSGRLSDARSLALDVVRSEHGAPHHRAVVGAGVVLAVVAAWRPNSPDEGPDTSGLRLDPAEYPDLEVRLGRARASAAAAVGRHDDAWRILRALWDDDGRPRHAVLSDLALGDLAAAAAHTDRRPEAARVVRDAESRQADPPSLRRRLVLHRAHALLAGAATAENRFQLAVGTLGGDRWPLDRALAQVDHAEWLRRRRRLSDARPHLEGAAATFAAAGATAWAARAARELAAGRRGRAGPPPRTGLPTLTMQERRIAELAAGGASNRQIADRLLVSVRTVTSNLTHVFHLLGVDRRMQLGAALERLAREEQ